MLQELDWDAQGSERQAGARAELSPGVRDQNQSGKKHRAGYQMLSWRCDWAYQAGWDVFTVDMETGLGALVWVRDVKTMCWKQDLTQMLGGRVKGWEGREGSGDWGGEDVYSLGAWVLFFVCFFVWFCSFFLFSLFFFENV